MPIQTLQTFFDPKRIALVGVSPNPNSVSGKVLANLVGGGFRGVVYPVNPQHEAVMGIACLPDLASCPRQPDLAVICTEAAKVPEHVRACGEQGIRSVVIMSAGFRETGEEGRRLEAEVEAHRRRHDGMRILGPNCLGLLVPRRNLNLSFAGSLPRAGHIAFISQSGALCTSVLDWALRENIGFSHFVSIGNTLDVDFGDLIDFLGEDEETRSIILYVESIARARRFMTAARAFARSKPIIVYKAGRFPESARVAASHTGALASEDAVYDAAFARMGLVRVDDIGEIFDCAGLVGRGKLARGPRLGIVTNAGGPGVMATDALVAAGGRLADLSPATLAALDEELPPMWSHANPVDVLGDARAKRLARAVSLVLPDENVDAVLVILTPQAMTNPTAAAKAVGELAAASPKPILAAWIGGRTMQEGVELLAQLGVPCYPTPEQAVRAFMTLVEYASNLEILYETPRDVPVEFGRERALARQELDRLAEAGPATLTEEQSKRILAAYGIPVSTPVAAATAAQAVTAAEAMGFPVVVKVLSPQITHKTDVGGVELNLGDAAAVRAAFARIVAKARDAAPAAVIEGVTVQPMARTAGAQELILGLKRDPVFGAVLLVGAGGVAAEILRDRALGLPPLNERLARRMLESLRIWPLLCGYRGRPAVNVDRLVEMLIRLSYLAADCPEIVELDVNPLLVGRDTVTALDARIVLAAPDGGSYDHLALRPYPEEYVREASLRDGTPVLLRPIKPEDEPLWLDLLGSCSRESIYMRFRYFFQWATHEVASRYCYIDYDREIAIVAEVQEEGRRRLVGVGRLVADPAQETVEYAVLISDAWQNRDLGNLLTDVCLEIAQRWGLARIVAQTTTDNPRMIAVFEKRGFKVSYDPDGEAVDVEKALAPAARAD